MSHTSLIFEFEFFLTLLACLLQYFLGKRYAQKDWNTVSKAIFWSAIWSLLTSWSVILAGNSHAGAILPVPSLLALIYLWQDTALWPTGFLSMQGEFNARLTLTLSALLPILTYLAAYLIHKKNIAERSQHN